jgi:ATP-dependent RNA helicase RhlE
MQTLSFEELDLIEPIQRALQARNYTVPTPIQQQAIPPLLAGDDLLGSAQTGSGKTAAFALPIIQHLAIHRRPPQRTATRTLILAPTRELVAQIADSFAAYGRHLGLRQAVVYGGVAKHGQIKALQRGVDVLTATPGRLLDLLGDGVLRLDRVEIFVLDEADRMLDMGFIPAINRIIAELPAARQSLFFSATLPPEAIRLARSMLVQPRHVAVAPEVDQAPEIDQRVLFVERENKTALLMSLLKDRMIRRVLVFTRTKHRAQRLCQALVKASIRSDCLHGNKSQSARQRALAAFHAGRIRVLVATDIAARGIDVEDISHVINFELPNEPESYVHRIGRTARAGKTGTALSFCDPSENDYLRRIERRLKHKMPVVGDHLFAGPSGPSPPQFAKASWRSNGSRPYRRHPRRAGKG